MAVPETMVALVTAAASNVRDGDLVPLAATAEDLFGLEREVLILLLCEMAGLSVALIERDAAHTGRPFDDVLRSWALVVANGNV